MTALALWAALFSRLQGAWADETCHHEAAPQALPLTDDSVYQLDVTLVDQGGADFALASLRGHPVLVSMVYTSCTAVCPMLTADLHAIEDALAPQVRNDVRVVLVSLDPARDTAERLGAFAAARNLDLDRWTLVRAPAEDVREIAAVLGVRYRALPDGDVNHSAVVALLDREGRVAARVDGVGADATALLAALGEPTPR